MARDDIADFGTYLAEERHASQNTICSYLRDVTQFSAYLREHQSALPGKTVHMRRTHTVLSRRPNGLGAPLVGEDV